MIHEESSYMVPELVISLLITNPATSLELAGITETCCTTLSSKLS